MPVASLRSSRGEQAVATEQIELALADIGEHFARYRLRAPAMERALEASLRRYGQMSPVVVFRWRDRYELVDGFKRLAAALGGRALASLWARVIEADERSAKAAIYSLNRISGKPSELEEAWIVHALVSDDGLPQVEVAELLGRHKSWVCRRLALSEKRGGGGASGAESRAAQSDLRAAAGAVAGGQPGGAARGHSSRGADRARSGRRGRPPPVRPLARAPAVHPRHAA